MVAVDFAGNRSAPATVEVTTTRATSTVTLRPTDDATVRQDLPSTNYGSATTVGADGSPVTNLLAKFTVATGQSVTGAKLRLYVTNPSDRSGEVRLAIGNAWSEGTVSWNSAPAAGSTVLAGGAAVATGTWVEFDVSRAVTADGTYSFRVTNPSWDGVQYASDEAGANRPELVVASAPSTATVRVPPTADATVKQAPPTTNYGASTLLEVDNSPVEHALARFDVSGTGGRPVLKAVLRLYCTNGSVTGGTVRPASPTVGREGRDLEHRPGRRDRARDARRGHHGHLGRGGRDRRRQGRRSGRLPDGLDLERRSGLQLRPVDGQPPRAGRHPRLTPLGRAGRRSTAPRAGRGRRPASR